MGKTTAFYRLFCFLRISSVSICIFIRGNKFFALSGIPLDMPSSATAVPASSDLLCARCGYVLSGLPTDSRCPECGTPIAESDPVLRGLPAWERHPGSVAAFLSTTAAVIFTAGHFFRLLATRVDRSYSRAFAMIHLLLASMLFAVAGQSHLQYVEIRVDVGRSWMFLAIWLAGFLVLIVTNQIAARLTHWEATYRGLRMPIAAVRRTMDYHAANYPLVALIAAITVVIFTRLDVSGRLPPREAMVYFYVLSGEVIVAAVYLFKQYWTAMRNVMYANA
jgi:hypothetical protein